MGKGKEDTIEMRDTPIADIAAQVYSNMSTVQQMAKKAKNLKGTYVKVFKTAARVSAVAVEEMLLRTKRVTDESVEEIRKENKAFKQRITELEKESEDLKNQMKLFKHKEPIRENTHSAQKVIQEHPKDVLYAVSELLDSRLNKFWDAIQTKLMRPELGKTQSDLKERKRKADTSLERQMGTLRINQEGKRTNEDELIIGVETEPENTWSRVVGRKKKEEKMINKSQHGGKDTYQQEMKQNNPSHPRTQQQVNQMGRNLKKKSVNNKIEREQDRDIYQINNYSKKEDLGKRSK